MNVSENPLLPTPRWLRAAVLLSVLVILPLGIAQAGEPDYEAVAQRLEQAVRAGELTASQAGAMMGELARVGFTERMEAAGRGRGPSRAHMAEVRAKIGAALRGGRISEEDARLKWEGFLRRSRGGVSKPRGEKPTREEMGKVKEEIWAAVKEGKVSEEDAQKRWEGYLQRVRGGEGRGGVEGHFERMGVERGVLDRIRNRFGKQGLTDEQIEKALGGMIRVVHELKSEGEDFELDPRLHQYFEDDVGLNGDQIEMVVGMARRIAHGMQRSER